MSGGEVAKEEASVRKSTHVSIKEQEDVAAMRESVEMASPHGPIAKAESNTEKPAEEKSSPVRESLAKSVGSKA